MKKLIFIFLLLLCCITVYAQHYRNYASTKHITRLIDSAMAGRSTSIYFTGQVVVQIDKDGYVTSCIKGIGDDEFNAFVPQINELLTKFKFKVEPFRIWGISYPSFGLVLVDISPDKNDYIGKKEKW